MPNLTKVKERTNNVKNKIYYGKKDQIQTLKFYDGNNLLAEVETGWHMPVRPVVLLAYGIEYFNLYVAESAKDDILLSDIIPFATVVDVQGEKFGIKRWERPRGTTREWYLRIETLDATEGL